MKRTCRMLAYFDPFRLAEKRTSLRWLKLAASKGLRHDRAQPGRRARRNMNKGGFDEADLDWRRGGADGVRRHGSAGATSPAPAQDRGHSRYVEPLRRHHGSRQPGSSENGGGGFWWRSAWSQDRGD